MNEQRRMSDLSDQERAMILDPKANGFDGSMIQLAQYLNINKASIYQYRHDVKRRGNREVALVPLGGKAKKEPTNPTPVSDGNKFRVKAGNVVIDVISESQAAVSGISVEEESIIIKVK